MAIMEKDLAVIIVQFVMSMLKILVLTLII